jgi:tRNA(Ile2) C34 agmatinyltransferase TiaS
MPCAICNHTVQSVGRNEQGFRQFWCSRCGTIKTISQDFESTESPRWTRLLVAAEWHEVKIEVADIKRLKEDLARLQKGGAP